MRVTWTKRHSKIGYYIEAIKGIMEEIGIVFNRSSAGTNIWTKVIYAQCNYRQCYKSCYNIRKIGSFVTRNNV